MLVWQGTQDVFDALLLAGLLVTATGIALLGLAMHADPAVGKATALLSTMLGAAGLVAGTFVLIGFHLILGRKLYRLSASSGHDRRAELGAPQPRPVDRTRPQS